MSFWSKMWNKLFGSDEDRRIARLHEQSIQLHRQGHYAQAISAAHEARRRARQLYGAQHPDFAASLENLAALYRAEGKYGKAKSLYRQALEIRSKVLPADDQDMIRNQLVLAELEQEAQVHTASKHPDQPRPGAAPKQSARQQRDDQARQRLAKQSARQQAADQARQRPTSRPPHQQQGDQTKPGLTIPAKPGWQLNNLSLGQQKTPHSWQQEQDPLLVAYRLNDLAGNYRAMGDLAAAEPLLLQALEIRRRTLGESHPDVAQSLNNLGVVYRAMGDLTTAEPLLLQALEIRRRTLGESHPDVANSLNNLAILFEDMRNYPKAEHCLRQAVEIFGKTVSRHDPQFATALASQAMMLTMMGKYEEAEPLHRQALEIRRTTIGEHHSDFANSLTNLAKLYEMTGRYAAAEPLLRQALGIRRVVLGEQHPQFASTLTNLAALLAAMGRYAAAEPLLRQALDIRRTVLGPEHPYVATNLNDLAYLYAATDRVTEALDIMKQASAFDDRLTGQVFSINSERDRLIYLAVLRANFNGFLSLVLQSHTHTPTVARAALDLVLRRKAIGAEALAIQRAAVLGGKYPALKPKLQELDALRMQIAQKTVTESGLEGLSAHQQHLAEWIARKERLEAELARAIPEMNMEQKLRSTDRQAVALALPAGTALVEFVRFDVNDFKAVPGRDEPQWNPPHYLAFVLFAREPDHVQMIDLGEAVPIDQQIAAFRAPITGGERNLRPVPMSSATDTRHGADLRAAVFDPLRSALGGRTRLFLAPDGDLTRLPFEVLPTDDGRRLIDDYHISYLSVGRDVLLFGVASTNQPSAPLVAADPDFDLRSDGAPTSAEITEPLGRRSRDLDRGTRPFERLPGTREEGEQVAAMLGVQPLLQGAVLEHRLKACQSPLILHIATHGFFLADQERDSSEHQVAVAKLLMGSWMSGLLESLLVSENPLLRSGLALAGANWESKGFIPPHEAEDGMLTAEDVSGLDLLATELVVLSACGTGLGEVHTGEGVFGLRRAFILAGAKTLVMSLWDVPDKQTQELMVDFYRRILAGQPRADALREAQLAIKAKLPDPRYWGAFICQGDPGPLLLTLDELGDRVQAMAHAEAALNIFEQIEDPNATEVRAVSAKWRMQPSEKDVTKDLLRAIECMERNNYQDAASLSMDILSVDRHNRFALQIAAMALRRLGSAEQATELWQQSLLAPFPYVHPEKELEILTRIGDLVVLFQEETYLSVNPEALAYANFGAELARMDDLQAAEEFFDKAIQIDPNCELAYYNRGVMAYNNRDFQRAADCMKEVLRINPGNKKAQNVLCELQPLR